MRQWKENWKEIAQANKAAEQKRRTTVDKIRKHTPTTIFAKVKCIYDFLLPIHHYHHHNGLKTRKSVFVYININGCLFIN